MSVKIYTAYCMKKPSQLWPFVRDTQRRGEQEVKKVLREMYENFSAGVLTDSEEYQRLTNTGWSDESARLRMAHDAITNGYRDQRTSSYRNPFNFDVSVVIREYKGRLYLIPLCDWMMRDVLDFLKEDPRLEDYSYWDNTDPPEEISRRAWKQRGKTWWEMDKGPQWRENLVITICDYPSFYLIDPYLDIQRERAAARKLGKDAEDHPES